MVRPDADYARQTRLPAPWQWDDILLALVLLTTPLCGLAHPGPPSEDSATPPTEEGKPGHTPEGQPREALAPQDPAARWLDEVRAQRKAWEDRRKANREAFEARRRMADPWGSAQQEAWEDEIERRRETRRQQREQQRELFRGIGPSGPPPLWTDGGEGQAQFPTPGQTPMEPRGQDSASEIFAEPEGLGIIYPPSTPPRGPYSPPNWDNLWYYRGY